MTRQMNRPESPKYSRFSNPGTHSSKLQVNKRQPSSPVQRSVKQLTKTMSKQETVAELKRLLPKTDDKQEMSELALVEKTIAYITYLERMLIASNSEDLQLQTAVDMLHSMSV